MSLAVASRRSHHDEVGVLIPAQLAAYAGCRVLGRAALFAAGPGGELCYRAWRLPRITGYAIGLIAGSFGFGVIDASTDETSRLLIDVALGLLLFEPAAVSTCAGSGAIRGSSRRALAEATLTFVLVLFVMLALGVSGMVALVLSAIAIATSPSMVIQLKTELRAEGQVSQRLITLTALNSVYAIVLTKLVTSWLHQEAYGNVSRRSCSRSTCSRVRSSSRMSSRVRATTCSAT